MSNKTGHKTSPTFALIFDMDGVLVDNLSYHFESWQKFASNHGAMLGKNHFFQKLNGRTAKDTIGRILHRRINKIETEQFSNEKERIYRNLYRPYLKPMPGLVEFLKALKRYRIPCALATSAPPENVRFILSRIKLRAYFLSIIDANGIKHSKPEPDIFLKAARKLGVKPERCIVFEDALLGIMAAKRARMKVIGVATTHSRNELSHADLVIKNFKKLDISKLQRLLEKS